MGQTKIQQEGQVLRDKPLKLSVAKTTISKKGNSIKRWIPEINHGQNYNSQRNRVKRWITEYSSS